MREMAERSIMFDPADKIRLLAADNYVSSGSETPIKQFLSEEANHFARLEVQVDIIIGRARWQAWHSAHLTEQWV